jgi:opacity protein-like surface antigen
VASAHVLRAAKIIPGAASLLEQYSFERNDRRTDATDETESEQQTSIHSIERCSRARRHVTRARNSERQNRMRSRAFGSIAFTATIAFASSASASPSTTSIEQGYDLGQIQSTRTVGMGDALNASGSSTSALYLNPANLAVARVYHFEGIAAFDPEARRQSYGGAIADSNTSSVAGGFAGTWNVMDPDGINRRWADLRLGLAYAVSDKLSIGVVGRYLRLEQQISSGPFGASYASDGTPTDPLFNAFTFDIGATVTPVDGLRIGVVGHNLSNPGTSLAPTTVAGGISYYNDTLVIEGDALVDFTTWGSTKQRYQLGVEYFAASHFPIRAGYRFDEGTQTHAISGGLGYVDKQWGLEASVRQDLVGEHPATLFVLGLRYFIGTSDGGSSPNGDTSMSPDGF